MDWQQKAAALNALSRIEVCIRSPGNWYVHQHAEIGGDGFLRGEYGNGTTPQEAIEAHWKKLTELPPDRYLVVNEGFSDRRQARWNGYMWVDVPREEKVNN